MNMQNEAKYAIEKFKITIFDQFSIFIAYMDIAGYGSTNCSQPSHNLTWLDVEYDR